MWRPDRLQDEARDPVPVLTGKFLGWVGRKVYSKWVSRIVLRVVRRIQK